MIVKAAIIADGKNTRRDQHRIVRVKSRQACVTNAHCSRPNILRPRPGKIRFAIAAKYLSAKDSSHILASVSHTVDGDTTGRPRRAFESPQENRRLFCVSHAASDDFVRNLFPGK